jgi:hypothetical protein
LVPFPRASPRWGSPGWDGVPLVRRCLALVLGEMAASLSRQICGSFDARLWKDCVVCACLGDGFSSNSWIKRSGISSPFSIHTLL